MKTIPLTFATFALLVAGCLYAPAAHADDRSGRSSGDAHVKSSSRMPAAGQPNRPPNRHFPPNYYLNRPLGSATNAPRGFYRQNLSYDPPPPSEHGHGDGHGHGHGHGHGGPIYLPQPVYYVVPPLFPEDDPLRFDDVRGPDEAVNPDEMGSRRVVIEADNLYLLPPEDRRALQAATEPLAEPAREPRPAPPAAEPSTPSRSAPAGGDTATEPTEPQDVFLSIQPADAVVWLDYEELGRAADLAGQVRLAPGVYFLVVEHDELESQRLFFGVVDQPVDVRVDLTAGEPRRRYRVR